jgi:nucleoside-triphosphatase THEP1
MAAEKKKLIRSYSVRDIENWKFNDQDIPEAWENHLGQIPDRWTMYVDGHPGNGKTEYILQLSKMLAMHVGKVRLNNVEQGKHKQIQLSVKRNNFSEIPAGKFAYDNIRDFNKYCERIKRPNSGKIQIIDSISYWPLSLKEVQFLLENFKNKCFVFVGYEKHYSANEPIIHHCDIKVRVSNFVAKSSGRFQGNEPYVIWDKKTPVVQPSLFQN